MNIHTLIVSFKAAYTHHIISVISVAFSAEYIVHNANSIFIIFVGNAVEMITFLASSAFASRKVETEISIIFCSSNTRIFVGMASISFSLRSNEVSQSSVATGLTFERVFP